MLYADTTGAKLIIGTSAIDVVAIENCALGRLKLKLARPVQVPAKSREHVLILVRGKDREPVRLVAHLADAPVEELLVRLFY